MKKIKKLPNNKKIIISAVVIGILFIISSLVSLTLFITTNVMDSFSSTPNVKGKISGEVAVIPIYGAITTIKQSATVTSDEIIKNLEEAEKNPRVKAIILEINSPGGSGVAADEVSQKIKSIDKPVIAVIRDLGASAAYWIASSCDYIYANRMSFTGSIGVIGSYLDFSGLLQEHNVSYERYVSGELKDMGSPFKESSDFERQQFQKIIDTMQGFFIEEVSINRNLSISEIDTSGRIYLGLEAKEAGLIDDLGTKDDAIKYIETQYNLTLTPSVYEQKKTFADILSQLSSSTKIGKFINPDISNYFQLT